MKYKNKNWPEKEKWINKFLSKGLTLEKAKEEFDKIEEWIQDIKIDDMKDWDSSKKKNKKAIKAKRTV